MNIIRIMVDKALSLGCINSSSSNFLKNKYDKVLCQLEAKGLFFLEEELVQYILQYSPPKDRQVSVL